MERCSASRQAFSMYQTGRSPKQPDTRTGTDYVTFTINGVNQNVTSPTPFTYTLKSDCTGMRTVLPSGPSFNIFAALDGDGLSSIATTPGFAESDYERRTGSQ